MKIRPHVSALGKPGAAKGNVVTDPKYNSRLFQPCLREHGIENCATLGSTVPSTTLLSASCRSSAMVR